MTSASQTMNSARAAFVAAVDRGERGAITSSAGSARPRRAHIGEKKRRRAWFSPHRAFSQGWLKSSSIRAFDKFGASSASAQRRISSPGPSTWQTHFLRSGQRAFRQLSAACGFPAPRVQQRSLRPTIGNVLVVELGPLCLFVGACRACWTERPRGQLAHQPQSERAHRNARRCARACLQRRLAMPWHGNTQVRRQPVKAPAKSHAKRSSSLRALWARSRRCGGRAL